MNSKWGKFSFIKCNGGRGHTLVFKNFLKNGKIIKGKEKLWTCLRLKNIKTIWQLHVIPAPKLDFVLGREKEIFYEGLY